MRILITGGSGFIGTNYIELLLKTGQMEFINLDIRPPRNAAHRDFWKECDLPDASRLKKIITDFSPTHVVHLAAKTGLDEKKLSDFTANMEGVENMLLALKKTPSIERVIFTSSLLVCKMGYVPKHDTDYQPTTLRAEQGRGRKDCSSGGKSALCLDNYPADLDLGAVG
jgi:nucleoside-diphosphate-sugar epimerase